LLKTKFASVERTLSVRLSHDWQRGVAAFDDANLVSCAGLVPVMELAEQTGLSTLLDEHVWFTASGSVPGRQTRPRS